MSLVPEEYFKEIWYFFTAFASTRPCHELDSCLCLTGAQEFSLAFHSDICWTHKATVVTDLAITYLFTPFGENIHRHCY